MRSFRFLLSRRWVLFAITIGVVAYATWWLGEWQFGRLEDRRAGNAVIRQNESLDPAPVEEVLAPGRDVDAQDEWRVVTASGRYAVEDSVVVRYRTRDGASGVDVVVPLVTSSGTALLVDRGWLPTDNQGASAAQLPAPPAGDVTVTGWVRADAEGEGIEVHDQSTRAISSVEIGEALDREVFEGFVELRSESPEPADPLEPVELPELDNGPHFFYGLQWWFFGVLAVGGFLYLAYDEWRGGSRRDRRRDRSDRAAERRLQLERRRARRAAEQEARLQQRTAAQSERSIPPSTGSIAPETKDAAGESRNAAARPNSSGRP